MEDRWAVSDRRGRVLTPRRNNRKAGGRRGQVGRGGRVCVSPLNEMYDVKGLFPFSRRFRNPLLHTNLPGGALSGLPTFPPSHPAISPRLCSCRASSGGRERPLTRPGQSRPFQASYCFRRINFEYPNSDISRGLPRAPKRTSPLAGMGASRSSARPRPAPEVLALAE